MRTELQYNLQKARALATELRNVCESLTQFYVEQENTDEYFFTPWEEFSFSVEEIENFLDEMAESLIGEGSVKLTVEPHVEP